MRSGVPLAETAAAVWRRLNAALMKGTAMMLVRAYKEAFGVEVGTSAGARAQGGELEGPIRIRVRLATCCC